MTQPNENRRLPLWWRALMAVSATAAIVVSFTYLRDLALYCGWPTSIAWLLPVSTDALAAGALTAYILTRSWWAAAVSAGVIAETATGNALAHIYDVTNTAPALVVVVAVGVAPVLNAFLIGHFVANEARKDRTWTPVPATTPSLMSTGNSPGSGASGSVTAKKKARGSPAGRRTNGAVPAATPAAGIETGSRPRLSRTDEELVQEILSRQWLTLSGDDLAQKLHVAKGRALNVRALAKESLMPSATADRIASRNGS